MGYYATGLKGLPILSRTDYVELRFHVIHQVLEQAVQNRDLRDVELCL